MALLLAGLPGRGRRADRQPAVRLGAPGDQLGRPRDRGRRRRRVHRRRRRVDDPRAVRHGEGRGRLGPRPARDGRHDPRLAVRQPAPRRAPLPVLDGRDRRERRRALGRRRASARTRSRSRASSGPWRRSRPAGSTTRSCRRRPAAEGRSGRRRPRRASARGHVDSRRSRGCGRRSGEGGTVTAGNSSGINDGASAVLVVEAERARELGLAAGPCRLDRRRRRRPGDHGHRAGPGHPQGARAGRDRRRRPRPGGAQRGVRVAVGRLHRRARPRPGEGQRQRRRDRARPSARDERGRLITMLAHELRRTGGRYGLATMCIGVGQGIATIIERIDETA